MLFKFSGVNTRGARNGGGLGWDRRYSRLSRYYR